MTEIVRVALKVHISYSQLKSKFFDFGILIGCDWVIYTAIEVSIYQKIWPANIINVIILRASYWLSDECK